MLRIEIHSQNFVWLVEVDLISAAHINSARALASGMSIAPQPIPDDLQLFLLAYNEEAQFFGCV